MSKETGFKRSLEGEQKWPPSTVQPRLYTLVWHGVMPDNYGKIPECMQHDSLEGSHLLNEEKPS